MVLIAAGCTGSHEFTGYRNIGNEGWCYGDRFNYNVDLVDTVSTGHILLSVTHDNSYEYSNLWLEVTYVDAGNECVDTMNLVMCDALGNWYGQGLPGHYQITDTVTRHPVTLTDSGLVTVRHIMRVDTIKGISQIGIEFKNNL